MGFYILYGTVKLGKLAGHVPIIYDLAWRIDYLPGELNQNRWENEVIFPMMFHLAKSTMIVR